MCVACASDRPLIGDKGGLTGKVLDLQKTAYW